MDASAAAPETSGKRPCDEDDLSAKRATFDDGVNIVVVGTAGEGKSHLINRIVYPDGQGQSPLQSSAGCNGVSLVPVRFTNTGGELGVRVVLRDLAGATRALQEAFLCANKRDLCELMNRLFGCSTIEELLETCRVKLAASAVNTVESMDDLKRVLKDINIMCLTEGSKASTRAFFAGEVEKIEHYLAFVKEQCERRVSKKFTKEEKAGFVAELATLPAKLAAAKANQASNNAKMERLPIGQVTKWIDVCGSFDNLPLNCSIIDTPGWGDTFDRMEEDIFEIAQVIILASPRIGGNNEAKTLIDFMATRVAGATATYSPTIVSYAKLTNPTDVVSDKEWEFLRQRWKTSISFAVAQSLPNKNPRMLALADRVYDQADVLSNAFNMRKTLELFVSHHRQQPQQQQQQQQKESVKPLTTTVDVDALVSIIEVELRKRHRLDGSLNRHVMADGSVIPLTHEFCMLRAKQKIAREMWSSAVDSLCDSVAGGVSAPTRKCALDCRETPGVVLQEINAVLAIEHEKFVQDVHQIVNTDDTDWEERLKRNLRAYLESWTRIICERHMFSVRAPAPVYVPEPARPKKHQAAYEEEKVALTKAEAAALASAVNVVRAHDEEARRVEKQEGSSGPSLLDTMPDVRYNKALMEQQVFVTHQGIEIGSEVHRMLQEMDECDDSLVAAASGYDEVNTLCLDTHTGASITFIFVTREDSFQASKVLRYEFDPALDHRDPFVYHHNQMRVAVCAETTKWTIQEMMNAICHRYDIKCWLHVPAGFCNLVETVSDARFRRQPVVNPQRAWRWMKKCFEVASDTCEATSFGGIAFGDRRLPAVVMGNKFGLVNVFAKTCSSAPMVEGKYNFTPK